MKKILVIKVPLAHEQFLDAAELVLGEEQRTGLGGLCRHFGADVPLEFEFALHAGVLDLAHLFSVRTFLLLKRSHFLALRWR